MTIVLPGCFSAREYRGGTVVFPNTLADAACSDNVNALFIEARVSFRARNLSECIRFCAEGDDVF
jgi:hypothetical protein